MCKDLIGKVTSLSSEFYKMDYGSETEPEKVAILRKGRIGYKRSRLDMDFPEENWEGAEPEKGGSVHIERAKWV